MTVSSTRPPRGIRPLVLALQIALVATGGLVPPATAAPSGTDAAATSTSDPLQAERVSREAVDGGGRIIGRRPGARDAAATVTVGADGVGCDLTAGIQGGVVSACPDATDHADLINGMTVAVAEAREEGATSRLSVTAEPDGAQVLIDGVPAGNAPVRTARKAGSYLVRVVHEGYQPYSQTVTLSPDRPATLHATLAPDPASDGWWYWVLPDTLTKAAGGWQYGDFKILDYIKDRDGNAYLAFENTELIEYPVERVDFPAWGGYIRVSNIPNQLARYPVKVLGVVRSTDNGGTWSLVKKWDALNEVRRTITPEFTRPCGDGCEHWTRAYYEERTTTTLAFHGMWPQRDGGIAVRVGRSEAYYPQTTIAVYGTTRTTGDADSWPETRWESGAASDPYYLKPTAATVSAWGLGANDWVDFKPELETKDFVFDTKTGTEKPFVVSGAPPKYRGPVYQGSRDVTEGDQTYRLDYFLGKELNAQNREPAGPKKRYVFTSRDGGRTLGLATTFTVAFERESDFTSDALRIAPDGTLFVDDLTFQGSGLGVVESGSVRWIGKLQNHSGWLAVRASANSDSAGNFHAGIVSMSTTPYTARSRVSYQYFPRKPVGYTRVALVTEPECKRCDDARAWLREAAVRFDENPTDLSDKVATAAAAAAAQSGYPVVIRFGSSTVMRGGAAPSVISRLLGVSYPVLLDERPIRVRNGVPDYDGGGNLRNAYGQWVASVVNDRDQVSLIAEQNDGVVAYADSGDWKRSRVMAGGYIGPSAAKRASPHWHAPLLPGGGRREVPDNGFRKVADLTYLYPSDEVEFEGYFGITRRRAFWTHNFPEKPSVAAPTRYLALAQASQLIPAAAFNVQLGSNGSPGVVEGELADYVTAASVQTVDGDRVYRVEVDLRKRDETAVGGDIKRRTIGGAVRVTRTNAQGQSETRTVSLVLYVDNKRLRYFDPELHGAARDLSSEAVHFTGSNDRWVITNNLAVANEIPCGEDQAILLEPRSTATFTAAQVASFELRSCLEALEVAPTPITGCTAWDDAKKILVVETMEALAQSLPLVRTGGTTNWELAFGSKDATVRRVITIDNVPPPGGGTRCASQADGKTAAVMTISGRILGGDEEFLPTVTVTEQGTTVVRTASAAIPQALAWQRRWLELEATFLETQLWQSVDDAALVDFVIGVWASRQSVYQRDLLAIRALLHCNQEGRDLNAINALLDRLRAIPDELVGPAFCLQGFLLQPDKHWPMYNKVLLPVGGGATSLIDVIKTAQGSNPTLKFLATSVRTDPEAYEAFILAEAERLRRFGPATAHRVVDIHARVLNTVSRELSGAEGGLLLAVLMSGPVDRRGLTTVLECARSFGTPNPYPKLIELTDFKSYTSGIPCVDAAPSGQGRIDRYRYLRLGTHGMLFTAILQLVDGDLDLLDGYLRMARDVITEVEASETKYRDMTELPSWNTSGLSQVDKMVVLMATLRRLQEASAPLVTVGSAAQAIGGVTECGIGLVTGLFTRESAGMIVLGGVAAFIGGPVAAGAGIFFVGSGLGIAGLAAHDLTQSWEQLDVQERWTGGCTAVASAVMTIVPARAGMVRLADALRRGAKPKVVDTRRIPSGGATAGLRPHERATSLKPKGRAVTEAPVVTRPPVSARLQGVLSRLQNGKRELVRELADRIGYERMTDVHKAIVDDLATVYGQRGGVRAALARRTAQIDALLQAGKKAEAGAWARVGAAFLLDLVPGRPKSLRVSIGPEGIAGSDAGMVLATMGEGMAYGGLKAGERGVSLAFLEASTSILNAFLESDRLLAALEPLSPARPAFTATEIGYLTGIQRLARPGMSHQLLATIGEARTIGALQQGVTRARQQAGVSSIAKVTKLEADFIASGQYKSAHRLRLTIHGRSTPLDIAIKKGVIPLREFALLKELGPKGITPKAYLDGLLQGVEGGEALSIEEWVAGKNQIAALSDSTLLAGMDAAIGRFDARLFLHTVRGVPARMRAYFNTDLHVENMKVYKVGDHVEARTVDFDPKFNHQVSPDQYWVASLARRTTDTFLTLDFNTYLAAIVKEFDTAGQRATAIRYLKAAAADLRNPARAAELLSIQFEAAEIPTVASETAAALEAFKP